MIERINNSDDIVIASRFIKGSQVNGVSVFRQLLSLGAKFLFKRLYPYENLNDYTCNFRAYRIYLIKDLCKNKKFFKNEEFNIAAKILLYLINKFKYLRLSEMPFKLSYDYKIGNSKMKLIKTILLTLGLIFNRSQNLKGKLSYSLKIHNKDLQMPIKIKYYKGIKKNTFFNFKKMLLTKYF